MLFHVCGEHVTPMHTHGYSKIDACLGGHGRSLSPTACNEKELCFLKDEIRSEPVVVHAQNPIVSVSILRVFFLDNRSCENCGLMNFPRKSV